MKANLSSAAKPPVNNLLRWDSNMSTQNPTFVDLNADVDYERAVAALKQRASALYGVYREAKADPTQTEEKRRSLLEAYGEAIEATKTLRRDDLAGIYAVLRAAA